MAHRPVCVGCQCEMIPAQNDIRVVSVWGKSELEEIWCADLLKCPKCQARVIVGFGASPIISATHPQYEAVKDACATHGLYVCNEER